MPTLAVPKDETIIEQFKNFVSSAEFPCVGAKSALNKGQMHLVVADDIRSAWDDLRILPHVSALAKHYRNNPALFQTLVIIFRNRDKLTEKRFEEAMWDRLQSLSDKDEWLGEMADPNVSSDPEDPHFALSFGGQAFFVVGLHPNASRPARRFDYPVMVFNLHDQFEQLREQGRYETMRNTILKRDEALAGSINPMLATHGDASAAPQYSGRQVGNDWVCPYSRKGGAAREAA